MMVNDLLNNLNSEQRQAVTYPEKSVLVLAGAGSGKTRVLTTRIAWLLSTGKADINSVMAVTFTNKAAREMGARLTTMLSKPVQSMWLGTFHGLCHRFLRLHHKKAGLSSTFQIMDTADQLSLIKRLLKQRNINPEFIQPRALQQFINSKKEVGGRAAVLSADDSYTQTLIECFADYERICQDEGLVDFAELILRSYEVLSSDESLRRHYQQKFRHILVDEFQDTNALQYQWIRLLAGGGACVFAVGDDDQSIYRFRGADVQNMNYLLRDFSIKNPIKLEQNYRSVGNILQAANAVIANNRSRLGKNLRTNAEDGEKLRFYHAYDDSSEARFVVREIQERLKENTSPQDIAILYRNNAQSRVLEQQLASENIPYRIYGGVRFYERQEVKLVLNYLRLVLDPDDNNAFLYIINTPSRSIGPSTIKKMQEQAQASKTSLFEVACAMALDSPKIDAFVQIIYQIAHSVSNKKLSDVVVDAIRISGLLDMYQSKKEYERLDNLLELVNAVTSFNPDGYINDPEKMGDTETLLDAFLTSTALESGERPSSSKQHSIQLMTVHAAKGLEFDTVFLTGLEEGLFPNQYALNEHNGEEEERRLMYVAITRAKKHLTLSAAQNRMLHGRGNIGSVSRFVHEIPDDYITLMTGNLNKTINRHTYSYDYYKQPEKEPEPPKQFGEYTVGDNVRHNRFGTGVITDIIPKGKDEDSETGEEYAQFVINFGIEGVKTLDTRYAKLSKITSENPFENFSETAVTETVEEKTVEEKTAEEKTVEPKTVVSERTSIKPVQVETKPVPFANKPVQVQTKPVPFANKSVQVQTKPVPFANKSAQIQTKPVPFANKPVQVQTKSVPFANKPVQVETKFVQVETKPVQVETAVHKVVDAGATEKKQSPKTSETPKMTKPVSPNARVNSTYAVGDKVRHADWGDGVVTHSFPMGIYSRLTIDFGQDGIKIMTTQNAALKKISPDEQPESISHTEKVNASSYSNRQPESVSHTEKVNASSYSNRQPESISRTEKVNTSSYPNRQPESISHTEKVNTSPYPNRQPESIFRTENVSNTPYKTIRKQPEKQSALDLFPSDAGYVSGEWVVHKKFGVGTVVCVLPQNEHKIIVTFESAGTRIFDMPYTSLKKYHQ